MSIEVQLAVRERFHPQQVSRKGDPLAAQQIGRVAFVNLAERDVLVLRPNRADDAIDRQIERGDLLLGQLDVDLAAQPAVHGDRRDAFGLRRSSARGCRWHR